MNGTAVTAPASSHRMDVVMVAGRRPGGRCTDSSQDTVV
jgi:hypothetical protein